MTNETVVPDGDFMELASQVATSSAILSRLLGRVAGQGRSVTAWRVLSTLDRVGPHRVGDLAVHERIAQPTMTGLVGRMEREGLVSRSADPEDGRAALVAVTDSGREVLNGYRQRATAALSVALDQMNEEELKILRSASGLFDRMIESLDAQIS